MLSIDDTNNLMCNNGVIFMDKKAIITGADGFIGRNIVKDLIENGYFVYAVVINTSNAISILGDFKNIEFIECDMNQYENLIEYDCLKNVSLLFHFAWAGVSDIGSVDYTIQLNNAKCSCDLQNVAFKLGIKRFVFASSIMEFEHQKAYENSFFQVSLRNTYHVTKHATRNLLQLRCNNMSMEFVPVIISNVYGIGENSPRLINTAIRKFINKEHMSFTECEQMYDFIYISDAARAIRLVAEKGANNKLYYIGNKEQYPLKKFLCSMRDIIAPGLELGIGEIQLQGISLDYNEFDTQAIFKDLNFVPEYTFEEGIRITAEWVMKKEID